MRPQEPGTMAGSERNVGLAAAAPPRPHQGAPRGRLGARTAARRGGDGGRSRGGGAEASSENGSREPSKASYCPELRAPLHQPRRRGLLKPSLRPHPEIQFLGASWGSVHLWETRYSGLAVGSSALFVPADSSPPAQSAPTPRPRPARHGFRYSGVSLCLQKLKGFALFSGAPTGSRCPTF